MCRRQWVGWAVVVMVVGGGDGAWKEGGEEGKVKQAVSAEPGVAMDLVTLDPLRLPFLRSLLMARVRGGLLFLFI